MSYPTSQGKLVTLVSAHVDVRDLDAVSSGDARHEAVGAAVRVVIYNDLFARLRETYHRRDRSHARREAEGAGSRIEVGYLSL